LGFVSVAVGGGAGGGSGGFGGAIFCAPKCIAHTSSGARTQRYILRF
jgi:hypothetical protein